jgi:Protein of unknown function (DUF938)
MSDDRQYASATVRNRDFILDALRDVLPMTGVILEIASDSTEHIVHFAGGPEQFGMCASDHHERANAGVGSDRRFAERPVGERT